MTDIPDPPQDSLRYAIRDVLIDFLLAIEERNLQKTPPTDSHGGTWPDQSDIYDDADQKLRAVFEETRHDVYLRDAVGDTFYLPFREGLKQWLGDEGYRMTINVEGMPGKTNTVAVVLRRGTSRDSDIDMLDQFLSQRSVECLVTVVGLPKDD